MRLARPRTSFQQLRPALAGALLALALAACGGGGDTPPAAPAAFTIAGSVAGLEPGNPVAVLNNGGDELTLGADGNFAFATAVTGAYAVTVGRQPFAQDCTVANAAGTAVADVADVRVNCAPYAAFVRTVAGDGSAGGADGNGAAASFDSPRGLATDTAGNLYVSEWNGGRLRKVTPAGEVSTVATGLGAVFGVAVGSDGNFYVAQPNGRTILKVTPSGTVSTFAGSGVAATVNGNGTAAAFNTPTGVVFDRAGNLYVAEYWGHCIRKITPAGDVTTFAGSGVQGATDGPAAAASFNHPNALAIDEDGALYVADSSNARIRKIAPDGLVSTLAGTGATGSGDGPAATATFRNPYGIAVGPEGAVYVADAGASKLRRISRTGVVSTIAGTGAGGSTDGAATTVATLGTPAGLAFDAAGNLYFGDATIHKVRRLGRQP